MLDGPEKDTNHRMQTTELSLMIPPDPAIIGTGRGGSPFKPDLLPSLEAEVVALLVRCQEHRRLSGKLINLKEILFQLSNGESICCLYHWNLVDWIEETHFPFL